MTFGQIGTGLNAVTKKGTKAIVLNINPELFKRVYPDDYKKIWIFPSKDSYVICAPMKEAQND